LDIIGIGWLVTDYYPFIYSWLMRWRRAVCWAV